MSSEDPTKDRVSVALVDGKVITVYVNNIRVAGRQPDEGEATYQELFANVGEIRLQLKRHPRPKKSEPRAKRRYRVLDFGDGVGEHLHTVDSAASTEAGFLRIFYQLYPRARRGIWTAQLTEGGAVILNSSYVESVAFIAK